MDRRVAALTAACGSHAVLGWTAEAKAEAAAASAKPLTSPHDEAKLPTLPTLPTLLQAPTLLQTPWLP